MNWCPWLQARRFQQGERQSKKEREIIGVSSIKKLGGGYFWANVNMVGGGKDSRYM